MSNLTVNKFLVNCFWPFASQSVTGVTSFSVKTVPLGSPSSRATSLPLVPWMPVTRRWSSPPAPRETEDTTMQKLQKHSLTDPL